MRHRNKSVKLNRDGDHQKALLRNLATSLILYDKIKTTKVKAKFVRSVVEKMITTAKKKDQVTAIRTFNAFFYDQNAGKKLIQELKAKYADRSSGFTRIIPLGFRKTDAAPLVQIELV